MQAPTALATGFLLLTLAACAPTASDPSTSGAAAAAPPIIVDGDAASVTQEAARELARFGAVPVEGTTNRLRAPFTGNGEVAECPPIKIRAQRRSRVASATDGFVELRFVPVAETEAARTRVDVSFIGRYQAPGTTGTYEAPCRSTGIVEQELRTIAASG